MNRTILTQSLFQTTPADSSSWRSYLTSTVVHSLAILAIFSLFIPGIQTELRKRTSEHITFVTPRLPEYKTKITPPRVDLHKSLTAVEIKPKPVPLIKPPELKPPKIQPQIVTAAPEIRAAAVPQPRNLPEPKFEVPAPKPEVHTGTFQAKETAKGPITPRELKVGGFGDPNGVRPTTDSRPSGVMLAKVGAFDMPVGNGAAGGGGRSASGVVSQSSFGSINGTKAPAAGPVGAVRTGGFSDSRASASAPVQRALQAEPVSTPVEIVSKPKPAYSDEARNLKLEGQVYLDVVFLSSGSVRVVRVVHGLGHGLDEAAEQAALQVRFKPATRGGVPIDTNATLKIVFQLT